jgi:hypothetical protein
MKNDVAQALLNRFDSSHKSFSFLADGIQTTGLNELLGLTVDVSAGIATCLDLVSSSDIARDCDETPTLSPSDSVNLMRLALAASKLLRDETLRNIESLNDRHAAKGGKS